MVDVSSLLQTDFKAVDKRDELRTVMGWVAGEASKVPIILDGKRPFGIVNERAMMSRSLDERAKVDRYTLPTRALALTDSLETAREMLAKFRAPHLPVEDERGQLAGYVCAIDVARELAAGREAREVAVPIATLSEESTMGEAVNAFQKEYVDFLPVTGGNGEVTGVLPRRAVLRMELHVGNKGRKDAGGQKFSMIRDPVAGVMDDTPRVVAPGASLETVLDTLESSGYALVPGADGGLAIVTPETLFQHS